MSINDHKPLRTRTTWKARSAAMNDPPANPGYESDLQNEHPASYPQPTEADLAKGDPSAWAEDQTPPPYKEGNPPANPGYDEFDKDHPAMYSKTREPMTASRQRVAAEKLRIKKLAVRCTKAARSFLGTKASEDDVVHLGTVLMSDPDRLARLEQATPAATSQLATSQQACGEGGVMGDDLMVDDTMDAAPLGPPVEDVADVGLGSFDDGDDDLDDLDEGTLDDGGVFGSDDAMNKQVMSALKDIQSAVKTQGQRLAMIEDRLIPASAKSAATKEAAQRALTASSAKSLFAALDGNRDGKVLASEWKGSRMLFAALDRNEDGVISAEDLYKGLGVQAPVAGTPALKPQDATLAARVAESEGEKEEMGEDGGTDDSGKSAGDDSDLPPFIKDKKEEDEANKEAAKAPTASKRPAASAAAKKPPKGKQAAEEDDDKAGDDDEQTSGMPTASRTPTASKRPKVKQAAEGDGADDDKDEGTDSQAASILAEDEGAAEEDEDEGSEPMASSAFFDEGIAPMSAADQAVVDEVFGGGQTAGNLPLNPQPRRASNGAKALGAAGMARQASTAKPAGMGGGRRRPEDMSVDELSILWNS